jgi:sulfate adenylyltransferase subunit 1 (EFTu-like GTPase family)
MQLVSEIVTVRLIKDIQMNWTLLAIQQQPNLHIHRTIETSLLSLLTHPMATAKEYKLQVASC